MAANEHKNLSDANRHNPKGFETALNDTVLGKGLGSGATATDANIEWQSKELMGCTEYKMQGYISSALTNYAYPEDIADNKSPFQWDVDFGSTSATGATINPKNVFRSGMGYVITNVSNVVAIRGWISSDGGNVVTVAICKVTPASGVATALTPVVIDEVTATGGSDDNKLITVNDTTITASALAAGDIIFPMVKEASGGSEVFVNLTVKTVAY